MSNKVAIVTDSTAYLPEEYRRKNNITITPGVMHDTFRCLIEPGNDALVIFVSSKISGTFQSALQARAILDPVETLCAPLSPVIGTHPGPGIVVLNFMSGIA